jgi:hypothetical protein
MPQMTVEELLLRDPLSDVTRQERSRLLLSTLVSLTVSKAGILPTRISTLGVEFSPTNRQAMLVLLAVVVGYFLLAFVIYGYYDIFLAMSLAGHEMVRDIGDRRETRPEIPYGGYSRGMKLHFFLRAALFEFGLPVVAGIYAIYALLRAL